MHRNPRTPPALYVCNSKRCDCLLEKVTKVNRRLNRRPVDLGCFFQEAVARIIIADVESGRRTVDLRYFFQEAVAPTIVAYVESRRSARVTMQY